MATLADLFEDTPAAAPLVAPPRLTVVPATPPALPAPPAPPAPVLQAAPAVQAVPAPPVAPRPTSRVDASQQTLRDSETRMILESEVKKAESRQADLLREYNNGQPEKRGGEAQDNKKYLDRVAELKASLARNESDMAGIRRELGRVPASKLTVVPPPLSDPVPIAAYPPAQPAAQTAKDVGNFSDLFETTVPAYQPGSVVQKPVPQVSAFAGTRGDTGISGGDGPIAQAALKHLKALGAATASLADTTIGGIIPGVAGPLTYVGARALQLSPEEAAAAEKSVVGALEKPFGKTFGVTESPAYKGELSREIMDFIGENVGKGAKYIAEKTGIPESDVANMIGTGLVGVAPAVGKVTAPVRRALGSGVYEIIEPVAGAIDRLTGKPVVPAVERPMVEPTMAAPLTLPLAPRAMSATQLADTQAAFAQRQAAARAAAPVAPGAPGAGSVGAAAVPTITTIQQALLGATPELKAVVTGLALEKTNVPTFMRHIEADSLPVPIRLTKGQASGDLVQLSNEQNRRGKYPELAQRFNEQNGLLIDNINEIRTNAAPDAYGTKIIENSQGIIDAYKTIDTARSEKINAAYKALEDANGGAWPVDALAIVRNADAMLAKKLKTNFVPPGIAADLKAFREGAPMTFEQFEALRTNLATEGRKAVRSGDGNAEIASSIVREALEQLPLTGQAAIKLKPLADSARSLAKERFDMLKKDPAYKAAVDDVVPADKFLQKFVVNGVNKNIATMVNHLGKDSVAHQHMAAGTVNWLKDKAGIVDETGNFTQAGFNKALKQLDDVKNMEQIFTPEAASQLKTLGNVARYTQAQPRGAFVNNSNTLVSALAEKAKQGISAGVEGGLNVVAPGLQLGTTVMEMRARRANQAEVRKALEIGAGTKK